MAAGDIRSLGSIFVTTDIILSFDSATTLTEGDLVNLQNGELQLADGGENILGQILEDATSASTGVQVNATPGLVIVMDNDEVGGAFPSTSAGEFFDIIGATGAQLVDTSSSAAGETTGSSGQLLCLAYNPQGVGVDSDTSYGKFLIKEHQLFGGAAV